LDESLLHRLDAISSIFKTSSIPVFVKFSNDTDPNLVSQLLKALMERGFSGVNFGNTSTRYEHYETFIHPHDKDHYKYFVNSFGGGLSGRLLRQNSELLIQQADAYCKRQSLQDFLIIATGGIETKHDFNQALEHGAHLAQWYTGYYEQFGIHGNAVYAAMYK
jgi:dihydroorotate dehydrogenase